MSKAVIQVENLSKRYRLGQIGGKRLIDDVNRWWARIRDKEDPSKVGTAPSSNPQPTISQHQSPNDDMIWALRDVSFEVKPGEVLGIIGRNGAGKSTLLKILSRVTAPTAGEVRVNGRIASLLEVGTGFHPELTGRENIFLNGAILGMTNDEIKGKFDEIVAFAELEQFIDTPVKRYSSGMYVRLAFAVAAHLEPEILIVDEVLAVGDFAFQNKCVGKMGQTARSGRTVLFVSHNLGLVRKLCSHTILLEDGHIYMSGTSREVISAYISRRLPNENIDGVISWENTADAPGGDEIKLVSIRLLNQSSNPQGTFAANAPVFIETTYRTFRKLKGMRFVVTLITQEGEIAFASTDHNQRETEIEIGTYKTTCRIPPGLLNQREYIVKVHAGIPGVKYLLPENEYSCFRVLGSGEHGSYFSEKWPGAVAPRLDWKTYRLPS